MKRMKCKCVLCIQADTEGGHKRVGKKNQVKLLLKWTPEKDNEQQREGKSGRERERAIEQAGGREGESEREIKKEGEKEKARKRQRERERRERERGGGGRRGRERERERHTEERGIE